MLYISCFIHGIYKGLSCLSYMMNQEIIKIPNKIHLDCSFFFLVLQISMIQFDCIYQGIQNIVTEYMRVFFFSHIKVYKQMVQGKYGHTMGIRDSVSFCLSSLISLAWSFASWAKKAVGATAITFISRKQEEITKKGKRPLHKVSQQSHPIISIYISLAQLRLLTENLRNCHVE